MPAPDASKLCRRKALPLLTNRIFIASGTNSPTNQPGLTCLRAYSLPATDFLPYVASARARRPMRMLPLSINYFLEVRQIVLRAAVDGRHEKIRCTHRRRVPPTGIQPHSVSNPICNKAQAACQYWCCFCPSPLTVKYYETA